MSKEKAQLSGLLAAIHSLGAKYEEKYGTALAIEDAVKIFNELKAFKLANQSTSKE